MRRSASRSRERLAVGGADFAQSTHAVWWLASCAGVLGFFSTTAFARRSAIALGPLLDPP